MRLINVVPIFPDRVDYMISEALRLYHDVGLNECAVMLSLFPESGETVLEKANLFKQVFHEYRNKLAGSGIKVGVLMQSLIGHGGSCGGGCSEPYQASEGFFKNVRNRRCIIDPGFLAYVRRVVSMIASEKPYLFLLDDDCRQIITNSDIECFCPLHMKQFNDGLSVPLTADELREKLRDAKPGDKTLLRFEELRVNNLVNFAATVRQGIDDANPTIPCGYCSAGHEFFTAEIIAKTVAAKGQEPFIRLPNASYMEGDAKDFPYTTYKSKAIMSMIPGVKRFYDESDTYPQHRYSKSAVSMHAHMTAAALNGLEGCKLWLTNLFTPDNYTERHYTKILSQNRLFYDTLCNMVSQSRPTGAVTPLPRRSAYKPIWNPLHGLRESRPNPFHHGSDCFYRTDWQFQIFAHFGIPAYYAVDPADGIILLTGDMLRFFSDQEIKGFLARQVLLDGTAAAELNKRNFGNLLGVEIKPTTMPSDTEIDRIDGIKFWNVSQMILVPCNEKTEILSDLCYCPFFKSLKAESVGAAITFFVNDLGGRILTYSEPLSRTFVNPLKRQQLLRGLEKINGGILDIIVDADQNVFTRSFHLPDNSLMLAIFNLNFDPMEEIVLKTASPVKGIKYLEGNGNWQNIEWNTENNRSIIKKRLYTYEVIVVKIEF